MAGHSGAMRSSSLGAVALSAVLSVLAMGCSSSKSTEPLTRDDLSQGPAPGSVKPFPSTSPLAPSVILKPQDRVSTYALLGSLAPAFQLSDLENKSVSLSDFKGKVVVLEWFNPNCPDVRTTHRKGALKGLPDRYLAKGVVWLGINSAAPSKEGFGTPVNRDGAKLLDLHFPILQDPLGMVGHGYQATTTPELYVIGRDGKLVYRGAPDNSPDGEGKSPEGGTLINYVMEALDATLAGKPVPHPDTKPYGCTVKYGRS